MSKPLVIFGCGEIGQLAHYYFSTDSAFDVQAFTVDKDYFDAPDFCGLPVIPFEELELHYPPSRFELFIALSYAAVNQVRRQKYLNARARGYALASYVSSRATVLNRRVIGENCFILEDNTIQPFVQIGNNVTLWSGNHIGHHSAISDHCFIASHAVISGGVEIGESCFVGINATIRDHVKLGPRCVIGAGALVMHDVAEDVVVVGNKANRSNVPSSRLKRI